MVRTKIKIITDDPPPFDIEILTNRWLEENPTIEIIDFKYTETLDQYHSVMTKTVCILYKEQEQ